MDCPRVLRPDDPVKSIMKWPVSAVDGGASLSQVAEELAAEAIGAVVVLEHGVLAGVVSERDVVRHLGEQVNPDHLEARDVMTVDLITVGPNHSIIDVARQLVSANVRHAPVVAQGAIAGMVSAREVLRVLTDAISAAATR